MPSEGRRLHGFTVVSRTIRIARQFLLPAIVGGASVGDGVGAAAQWTLVILALPSFAVGVAQWLAFRYRLDGDELVIDSGVLSRRRRVIPVARIQNVDLKQSALERLAGVAELRLETASGGAETEASLAVLDLQEAHRLQAGLRELRATHDGEAIEAGTPEGRAGSPISGAEDDAGYVDPAAGPRPEPLLRLSVVDLVIAGATSNEAGLIAAGLATGIQFLDDFGILDQADLWLESLVGQPSELSLSGTVLFIAVAALAFIVFGWVLSIGATVVRFYGFTLTRVGDDLRREYGLFSRHHSTVPLERVQVVRIEETLLRRPLGLAALKIESAGSGPKQRKDAVGGGAEAYVPITRRRDVGRLIRAVFDDARLDGVEMHPVASVSLRRSFVRLAVPILLGTALATWFDPAGAALAALLIPAWFFARAEYRARAWGRAPGYVLVRGGVLTRTNAVIPDRKVQTLHLQANPFQRRLGVTTLLVDTAGGGRAARAVDLREDTAHPLLLTLAHDAERARRA